MVAFVVFLTACSPVGHTGQPDPAPDAVAPARSSPIKGGVLRIATLGTLTRVFHPYPQPQHSTTPRRDAMTLIHANLIDTDWERLEYVADPRRSMARELPRASSDGVTYTITLRDDIYWSDGTQITAADFQFAIEHARERDNNYVGLIDLERVQAFRVMAPNAFEVTFGQTLAASLILRTFEEHFRPVPRHVWQNRPWYVPDENPELLRPTVVSGPFTLQDPSDDQQIYIRNPNWWGKQPNLDQIIVVSASTAAISELLRTGQIDWADSVPPSQFAELKLVPQIRTLELSGATATYRVLQFNLRRQPLRDKRVREALIRAIHREDLVQFEDDLAMPQFSLYTEDNARWVNPQVEKFGFDLTKARQLMVEAGFVLEGSLLKDSTGQTFKLDILWPTSSQPRGKIAAYLQQQWKQLGIEATVTALEFSAFTDRYQRQFDFDIAIGSFSPPTFDPDLSKNQFVTDATQNVMGYSNPRIDELFELGAVERVEARRKQLYDEAQTIIVQDLPVYYMVTTKSPTALDRRVGGVSALKGNHLLRQNNLQVLDWYIAS
jgi:peptide/nickel transport system substrate-binding protein